MKKIPVDPRAKALLFDCDGTLVDSMALHMEAWSSALKEFGEEFDYDYFFSKKGMKEEDIVDLFNRRFDKLLNPRSVVEAKHRHFWSRIGQVKPIDAVVDIVHRNNQVLPLAVVSGSRLKIVRKELEVIGIERFFGAIITADDPIPQKPAPDMFFEAARMLGVPPSECQVFEDGDLGLEAARRGGMIATDIRLYE